MAKKSVSDDTYSSMKSMSRNMRPGGGPRISGSKWSTGGYKSGDYAAYRAYSASKMPKATGEERISSPQKKVGLVGGLGMQAYNSPGSGQFRVNPLSSTEKRNYQYGNVLAPAANKKAAPSVVRATTNMKTSPVNAQSAKPSFKANWVGAAPTAMQARGGARTERGGGLFGKMGFGGKSSSDRSTGAIANRTGGGGNSMQRAAARAAADRNVAGPRKDSSGRNVSSMSGKRK